MGKSFVLDYVINNFGTEYIFGKLYVAIFILSAIAYKLGFAKKLPPLKSIFVYVLLALGVFVLTILGTVFGAPIIECLIIITAVLGIYRYRLHRERKAKNN